MDNRQWTMENKFWASIEIITNFFQKKIRAERNIFRLARMHLSIVHCPSPIVLFLLSIIHYPLSKLHAQQLPAIEMYRHNWGLLNPAAFNRDYFDDHDLRFFFNFATRQQWINIDGSPRHYNLRFEFVPESENARNMKFGVYLLRDQAGASQTDQVQLNYAYAFKLDKAHHNIALGLSAGWLNNKIDYTKVDWKTNPGLTNLSQNFLNLNFGVFYNFKPDNSNITHYSSLYRTGDLRTGFYAGLSTLQLLSLNLQSTTTGDLKKNNRVQHFYGLIGYAFSGFESSLWLRYMPNVQFQTIFKSPLSLDANLRYVLPNNSLWFGSGIHSNATLSLEFGGNIWFSSNSKNKNDKHGQWGLAFGGFPISSNAFPSFYTVELNTAFVFGN